MKKIEKKIESNIEEIRRKPENIRIRYVWACVAFSMVFILVIWFFSIGFGFSSVKNETPGVDPFAQFREEKQTINEYRDQLNNMKSQIENAASQEFRDDSTSPEDVTPNFGE